MTKKSKNTILILLVIMVTMLVVFESTQAQKLHEPIMKIRIMETTDLHAKMLGYDYELQEPVVEYGLERTYSLIKQSRKEVNNSLLFDVGDALVGNELGDYALKSNMFNWMDTHPVYKVMNLLNYDAATIGNHEFNYGLNFLMKSLQTAEFPIVNANVYVEDHNSFIGDDLHYFKPYIILNKKFKDTSGKKHHIKVGVIGLLTPIAAEWDKEFFKGKLKVKNMRETAEHYIPIMKEKGADIIVALVHSGLGADEGLKYKKGNSVYSVSKIDGIDAILYGHSHSLFPNKDKLPNWEGIDLKSGTINGTAAVQAGYWGNHLGIIDLKLTSKEGKWVVVQSQSSVKPIYRTVKHKKVPVVPADPLVNKAIKIDHRKTLDFLEKD